MHNGQTDLRDIYIRVRLRKTTPPWRVVELYARDLSRGRSLVAELQSV